jgi:hypothetical protein
MSLRAENTSRLKKTNEKTLWLLFFIWPVWSFLLAIKNFHVKRYRKFILLFGVLYGFTFIPIPDSDGYRYAQRFEEIGAYPLDQLIYELAHIYEAGALQPDVYIHALLFFTSKFSDNARFFHMVTALIYFLVFIKLLSSVFDLAQGARGKYYLWFFLGCVFVLNFSIGVNGVRYPLGFMVFALGAFQLIVTRKTQYLGIAFLSPFIHFMFVYPVIFLLIFHWFPFSKNQTFLLVFLLLAFFAGTFFHTIIQNNIGFFGDALEDRFMGFTHEAWIDQREEHVRRWHWYVELRLYATYFFSMVAVFFVWLRQTRFRSDGISKNLLAFTVFMIIASVISGGMIDAASNRYAALAVFFSMAFLYYLSSLNPKSLLLKTISRIYIPIFILHALVIFRADFFTVSPWLIFGNPVLMWLFESTVSIQELILGS